MSSKKAVVEEFNSCPSWFETINSVSALAVLPNPGIRPLTSCSADQSAGLKSFALSFPQTKADVYYHNWRIEGGLSVERLFGRCCDASSWCCVGVFFLIGRFGIFEISYYAVCSFWMESKPACEVRRSLGVNINYCKSSNYCLRKKSRCYAGEAGQR